MSSPKLPLVFALLPLVVGVSCGQESHPLDFFVDKHLVISSLMAGAYHFTDQDQQVLGVPMRIEGGAKAEDGCDGKLCRPLEPSFEVGGSMMLYESDSVALSASMSLDVEVSDEESATDFPFAGTFGEVDVEGTVTVAAPKLVFKGFDGVNGGHLEFSPFGSVTEVLFRTE